MDEYLEEENEHINNDEGNKIEKTEIEAEVKDKFFREMKKMCYDYESKLADFATQLERANYENGMLRKQNFYKKQEDNFANNNTSTKLQTKKSKQQLSQQ